jgi:hypothetical protein
MNIREIVKDSLKYPLSNWKSYLILGIIILFINLHLDIMDIMKFSQDNKLIIILWIIGLIIGLFAYGYIFKIIKSSLSGINELPKFNDWVNLFTDGFKTIIVVTAYLIPVFLLNLGGLFFGSPYYNVSGILVLITVLYMVVIIPTIAVAITSMAHDESKLRSAFRFHRILEKISTIGWGNLIIWYIVIGIFYLIILAISFVIYLFFSLINPFFAGILESLILVPYPYIFIARSVALFYMSNEENKEIQES